MKFEEPSRFNILIGASRISMKCCLPSARIRTLDGEGKFFMPIAHFKLIDKPLPIRYCKLDHLPDEGQFLYLKQNRILEAYSDLRRLKKPFRCIKDGDNKCLEIGANIDVGMDDFYNLLIIILWKPKRKTRKIA